MYNIGPHAQSYGISSYMRTHNLPVTAHLHSLLLLRVWLIVNCRFCICAFPHLAYATNYRPVPIIDQLVTYRHLSVVCSVFTVGIPLNIYSVTDLAHYIMSVSGQCTFVFQWSLWEHMALQTMTMTPFICKVQHPTCDSASL